jgi:hypothetical protein
MSDMSEQQFGSRIRQALNQGARLEPRIAERLRAAREMALERRRAAPVGRPMPELDWASVSETGVLARFGGFGGFSLRILLPVALMVVGVIGIYTSQQAQQAADVEQLDAQLLTDDLPIDAYLDRGFEAWLKKVSAGQ